MRISAQLTLVVFVLAFGPSATAQAIGEMIQLSPKAPQGKGETSVPTMPGQTQDNQTTVENEVATPPRPLPDCNCAREPYFSVNGGDLAPGTQITIASPAGGAVIYYTIDGWTPTEASPRYTGPITINADTRLRAFAEEPNKLPSAIVATSYLVDAPAAPKPESVVATDGFLHKGTPLRLVTAVDVASDAAQIGDPMPLQLDENVMAGGTIVVPKGTPAEATITRVQHAGPNGKPGVIVFQVQSLKAGGIAIPLNATLTLSAPDLAAQARSVTNPSQVHVSGGLPPGDEVEIEPGMDLTAYVAADTGLHP